MYIKLNPENLVKSYSVFTNIVIKNSCAVLLTNFYKESSTRLITFQKFLSNQPLLVKPKVDSFLYIHFTLLPFFLLCMFWYVHHWQPCTHLADKINFSPVALEDIGCDKICFTAHNVLNKVLKDKHLLGLNLGSWEAQTIHLQLFIVSLRRATSCMRAGTHHF